MKLLVIGCGGVATVAIHKCCENPVFTEICIASRTVSKCEALAQKLQDKTAAKLTTAKVDADSFESLTALMKAFQPHTVLNVALPYQDLVIMDACLACGANYVDTANYEAEDTDDPTWREIYEKRCKEKGFTAYFDYSWQWAYHEKFRAAGLTALLGTGFDPGGDVLHVQHGDGGIAAVVFDLDVDKFVGLQHGGDVLPVAEDELLTGGSAENLTIGEFHGGLLPDIDLHGGLLFRGADVFDDFLCVHSILSLGMIVYGISFFRETQAGN